MKPLPRWLKFLMLGVGFLLMAVFALLIGLGWYVKRQMLPSGGELPASMAAYDVRHYDLAVQVEPDTQSIEGVNTATVEVLAPLSKFEIHLDNRMEVAVVEVDGAGRPFRHRRGVVRVDLDENWNVGERHAVTIAYGGEPKVALRPPWIDGFRVVRNSDGRALDRGDRTGRRRRQLVAVQGPPVGRTR